MRIGLIHYRAGLMDGVSLEMEKWRAVLTGMGHSVEIVAGNSCPGVDITIPGIEYNDVRNHALKERLYEKGEIETQALFEEIHERSEELLLAISIESSPVDLLVPNKSVARLVPASRTGPLYVRQKLR
jgi:hypothetical protein